MRKGRAGVIGALFIVAVVIGGGFIALQWWPGKPSPTIVPVEGIIRIDGKPLKRVTVRFIPTIDYGPEYIAYGITDEQGRYTLVCNDQEGACEGENQVLIRESPPPLLARDAKGHILSSRYYKSLGGRPVPPKYANLAVSPLTADVQDGQTQYNFDLTR